MTAKPSKGSVALPEDIIEKLETFDSSLDDVEKVLTLALATPLGEIDEKLPPLDRAKFDVVMAYLLNSLFWMYLITVGENPKQHGVKSELERIRNYMMKLKEIVDKEKAPRLDAEAAKRFVRGSLWTPKTSDDAQQLPKPTVEESVVDLTATPIPKRRKKSHDSTDESTNNQQLENVNFKSSSNKVKTPKKNKRKRNSRGQRNK